jgi:UDP-N-acetylmuramoylalanine--D-glutamate ligase
MLVIGAARSGRAVARLLAERGQTVLLTDDHVIATDLPRGVEFLTGAEADARIATFDRVVVSPGIAVSHRLVRAALSRGATVQSELAVAAEHVTGRVLAVTGTNGKSTVTTLLAAALRESGRRVFVGGNLGTPLSDAAGGNYDDLVLEISSFQLEWPHTLVPAVATVLNLTPDHLDRHGTMEVYADTKLALFANMGRDGCAVFNRDESWWRQKSAGLQARVSTFGQAALEPGDTGTVFSVRPRRIVAEAVAGHALQLAGRWPEFPHDIENVAAVAELCRWAGVPDSALARAVAAFEPLPHRLACVGEHRGVSFYDDSKATNVGATLKSLEAFDRPVVLLAGGTGKGAGFELLAGAAERLRVVIAYGEARDAVAAGFGGRIPVVCASGFEEAFAAAVDRAVAGDIVLLAPACASFDEFRDYADRGRRFVDRVKALAVEA